MGKEEEFENRLKQFALRNLDLVRSLARSAENRIYGGQLLRSSSSIGANYTEATCAASRKDFVNELNIARKEAKETLYWLALIEKANSHLSSRMKSLISEGVEIYRILVSSVKTTRESSLKKKS